MAELVLKLALAGGAALWAYFSPAASLRLVGGAAMIWAAVAVVSFLLDRRSLRTAHVWGVGAAIDSAVVVGILAHMGLAESFAFLALAPLIWAFARGEASPAVWAPLSTGAAMASANAFGSPGWSLYAQLGGIGLLGLMLRAGRQVVVKEMEAPVAEVFDDEPQPEPEPPVDMLELRESFRVLRDHARSLEERSRGDRSAALLFKSVMKAEESPAKALADELRQQTGAEGLLLYRVDREAGRLVTAAAAGVRPAALERMSHPLRAALDENAFSNRISQVMEDADAPGYSIPHTVHSLRVDGKLAGLVCLLDMRPSRLAEACDRMRELESPAAALLKKIIRERGESRSRIEAETLYTIASTSAGSDTLASLCRRVARELREGLGLDRVELHSIEEGSMTMLASEGRGSDLMDAMSFSMGPGAGGWLAMGAPELHLAEAREDMRVEPNEASKRRVGSYAALSVGEGVLALTASTQRSHGITPQDMATLRLAAAELSHAVRRIDSGRVRPEGLATPSEFQALMKSAGPGALVHLEVLRAEELRATVGSAALDRTLRTLAQRLRATLPEGGAMCRREDASFLAFLEGYSQERAREWANEAAALGAMISARTDGAHPLALRARAAAAPRHPGGLAYAMVEDDDEPIMSEEEAKAVKAAILAGLTDPQPEPAAWQPPRMTREEAGL